MPKNKSLKARQYRLSGVVTIKAGYPFRGSLKEVIGGGVRVIQAKDISDLGELIPETAIETELTGKREADWLEQGDVLFISKGQRIFASYIEQDYPNYTCAPSLFILRPASKWQGKLNMQFITWQLNQGPAQTYFKKTAEGSTQINIRKQVLADLRIGVPSLAQQNLIAKLYQDSVAEQNALQAMIDNRKQQNNLIAAELLR